MLITRARLAARGWIILYVAILAVLACGWELKKGALIYAAGGMWLLFVLFPGLLSRIYYQRFLQQRYSAARRIATLIGWLHPVDGWRQQPQIIRALELAQHGDVSAAAETLTRFQQINSVIGLAAVMHLYRLADQWEELLAWYQQDPRKVDGNPQFLPVLLRAYGETGDVAALIELYARNHDRIARLMPVASRDLCRLVLFAFCGKRLLVEKLFSGSLSVLPVSLREFWLATTDLAAGETEAAKGQLEQLLTKADPPLRRAIQRRLSHASNRAGTMEGSEAHVIEEAAREQWHDHSFGAQRSLWSSRARGTQLLIALNLVMFAVEIFSGGDQNPETLYRLGAMFPPVVRGGEWWRLIASLFLHWGPLHLTMNMIALWLLGPFTEFALGFRRFLLVYFFAGIGSMGTVMLFGHSAREEQLTVGASGCILGLIGATGALMLRGWLRERALSARRRLIAMLLVVIMQTAFDAAVPQVSMTAHLSGALLGFAITLMLKDNLRSSVPLSTVSAEKADEN